MLTHKVTAMLVTKCKWCCVLFNDDKGGPQGKFFLVYCEDNTLTQHILLRDYIQSTQRYLKHDIAGMPTLGQSLGAKPTYAQTETDTRQTSMSN